MTTTTFPLLRPEYLPGSPPTAGGELRELLAAIVGQPDGPAADAVRSALRLDTPEMRLVINDPDESGGNRHNDRLFGIIRVDGEQNRILRYTALSGYGLLLDEAARFGTSLDEGRWTRLRRACDVLIAPDHDPEARYQPTPASQSDGTDSDAYRRWVHGHLLFMVLVQGLIVAVNGVRTLLPSNPHGAARALRRATVIMSGSEGALRFATDFTSEQYQRQVRPTLTGPQAPPSVSGLHWRDHEYLVSLLAVSQAAMGHPHPEIRAAREEFRASYGATMQAHQFVCSQFVGDDGGSLLNAKSKQSAVDVLARFQRVRLANVPE